MTVVISIITFLIISLLIMGLFFFSVSSVMERKYRAAAISGILVISVIALLMFLLWWNHPLKIVYMGVFSGFSILFFAVLIFPVPPSPLKVVSEQSKIDERDAIFHRFWRLEPGMWEFDQFYQDHPELEEIDENIRNLPGLGGKDAETYHPETTPFNAAIFDAKNKIFQDLDWKPEPLEGKKIDVSPEKASKRIKGFAQYLGADLVGITRLNQAYVYSHIGRSPGKWGSDIKLDHTYAVVFAVEMDHDMISNAPHHLVTTESATKYLMVSQIALVLARYIHMLGYEARAHVDSNYRVMCGPIAVEAGLGELGRLGLLITPEFGPRVRLAVVTTNIPLICDKKINFGVQDFCEVCKKCAVNCPSGAIEKEDKKVVKGVEKWQSSQEKCFRYWCRVGSDCSMCLKVCPYSHPHTFMHNIVRWFIKRNGVSHRLALWMDDLFYGRRPPRKYRLPEWHRG